MSMNEQQQQRIKHQLDQQVDQVKQDAKLAAQLRQARTEALTHRKPSPWTDYRYVLTGAIAASLLIALLIPSGLLDNNIHNELLQDIQLSDMELLTELEDYEQDLEFYYWLEFNGVEESEFENDNDNVHSG